MICVCVFVCIRMYVRISKLKIVNSKQRTVKGELIILKNEFIKKYDLFIMQLILLREISNYITTP